MQKCYITCCSIRYMKSKYTLCSQEFADSNFIIFDESHAMPNFQVLIKMAKADWEFCHINLAQ